MYGGSLALLTDLYQLTMACGYWKAGNSEHQAVFHLTYRRQPFAGGYAIAAGLAPALAFLESSGQLRGPPLLTEDASWIVSLEGAPPGDYPFRCLTHGAAGSLTVSGSR